MLMIAIVMQPTIFIVMIILYSGLVLVGCLVSAVVVFINNFVLPSVPFATILTRYDYFYCVIVVVRKYSMLLSKWYGELVPTHSI